MRNNFVDDLLEKVKKNILENNYIQNGDKIVIGVSGGADSICLLHMLYELKDELSFTIYVAHINHKIRKESDREAIILKEKCEKLNIPFYMLEVDAEGMAKKMKIGTEEAGRIARYNFFNEVLKNTNSNKIAIAHNLNDKVETVLLNILRGSGIKGLIGIREQYENIIRPILILKREEIEKYCKEKNIDFFTDKTNFEAIYTRNKVRLNLIPNLQEYNPNILETITRLSNSAMEDIDFIEEIASEKYNQCIISCNNKEIVLDRKKYSKEHVCIRKRIVIQTIIYVCNNIQGIGQIHIEDIDKLITKSVSGKKYIIGKKLTVENISKDKFKVLSNN